MARRALALGLAAAWLGGAACSSAEGPSPRGRRSHPSGARLAKAVIRTAKSYLAEEEKGRKEPADCSDLVRKVFKENGLDLPRTALEMSLQGKPVESAKDLRMGDLVFFSGEKVSRIVGHVGIYVKNGIFIHKPKSGEVAMESLYSDYYRQRYLTGRRVIP